MTVAAAEVKPQCRRPRTPACLHLGNKRGKLMSKIICRSIQTWLIQKSFFLTTKFSKFVFDVWSKVTLHTNRSKHMQTQKDNSLETNLHQFTLCSKLNARIIHASCEVVSSTAFHCGHCNGEREHCNSMWQVCWGSKHSIILGHKADASREDRANSPGCQTYNTCSRKNQS